MAWGDHPQQDSSVVSRTAVDGCHFYGSDFSALKTIAGIDSICGCSMEVSGAGGLDRF